jgi:hypothetical protein
VNVESKGTEEVWQRVKAWADQRARETPDPPTDEECEAAVRQIAGAVMGRIDEAAIQFYTAEACAMAYDIANARRT